MGIFSGIGSIIGGNKAAGEIEEQARANIDDISTEQGRQEDVNQPFLGRGTQSFNRLADLTLAGPGELSEPEQLFMDDIERNMLGSLSARGLSDSGAGINALSQALMRGRLGLRQNRLAELGNLAQFGERGANRFNQIGQFATGNRLGQREQIGQANAFAKMNMFNQLGGIGDNLLSAAAGGFGGAFDPGMFGQIAGSLSGGGSTGGMFNNRLADVAKAGQNRVASEPLQLRGIR